MALKPSQGLINFLNGERRRESREHLHQLVDILPDNVLDKALRVLVSLQHAALPVWTGISLRARCLILLCGGGWGPVAPPVFKTELRGVTLRGWFDSIPSPPRAYLYSPEPPLPGPLPQGERGPLIEKTAEELN